MTSSVSVQDEPNPALRFATGAGKMELSFIPYNESFDIVSVPGKHAKKELIANIQPSWPKLCQWPIYSAFRARLKFLDRWLNGNQYSGYEIAKSSVCTPVQLFFCISQISPNGYSRKNFVFSNFVVDLGISTDPKEGKKY